MPVTRSTAEKPASKRELNDARLALMRRIMAAHKAFDGAWEELAAAWEEHERTAVRLPEVAKVQRKAREDADQLVRFAAKSLGQTAHAKRADALVRTLNRPEKITRGVLKQELVVVCAYALSIQREGQDRTGVGVVDWIRTRAAVIDAAWRKDGKPSQLLLAKQGVWIVPNERIAEILGRVALAPDLTPGGRVAGGAGKLSSPRRLAAELCCAFGLLGFRALPMAVKAFDKVKLPKSF